MGLRLFGGRSLVGSGFLADRFGDLWKGSFRNLTIGEVAGIGCVLSLQFVEQVFDLDGSSHA